MSGSRVERIAMPGDGVELSGLAAAAGGDQHGLPVLMIHENRGLVPYMREVVTMLSVAGHAVVAPDLLSRIGGTDAYVDDPTSVSTRQIPEDVHEADLVSVFDWMSVRDERLAVVGFCFGAEMGWRLITRRTPERAALYYGIGPAPARVRAVRCPVFAVYAEDDRRVNRTVADLAPALTGSDVDYRLESFPGTKHAFHDHRRPDRHHPRAAERVWSETLDFLR